MYYFFAIWFLNCFAFSCFARVLIFSRYKFCFCFEVKQLRSSSLWLEDSTFEKMSVRNVGSLIICRRRVLAPGCPFVAESLPLCHAVARGGGGWSGSRTSRCRAFQRRAGAAPAPLAYRSLSFLSSCFPFVLQGPPEFPQHTPGPVPNNFSQPPRLPLQDQWRAPPPPQERDPFFLGGEGGAGKWDGACRVAAASRTERPVGFVKCQAFVRWHTRLSFPMPKLDTIGIRNVQISHKGGDHL